MATVVAAISEAGELAALLDAVLAGIERELGIRHAMILAYDSVREELTTVASRGYGRSGIGSEVALGDGMIGVAALERRCLWINDMSRVRRVRDAITGRGMDENQTRAIALPGLPDALSQLAMPIIVQGQLRGIIMLESPDRLAFPVEFEAAMDIIARHLGLALDQACIEVPGAVPQAVPQAARQPGGGRPFRVVHHRVDDSVFIDNEYIIKGVSGRLLMGFLAACAASGRRTFSNREIRADPAMRLPDLKDNLETRLLLLQRRLEERGAPVRVDRPARGRIVLTVAGQPLISEGAG